MVLMNLMNLIKRSADPCAGKASFAGRRQKKNGREIVSQRWLDLGRKWAQMGACWGLHVMRGKQVPTTSLSKLECTSLSLVSSLGATGYDSATHPSETISSPIGCQHISHAGALYCRTTTASNACSAATYAAPD